MAEAATDRSDKAGAILDAAQDLFTRFGFRRTTMDDIARAAGVAKGTLYLYFANKAEVFRAMQRRTQADIDERCDAVEAKGGDVATLLLGLLDASYGEMQALYGQSDFLVELGATRATVGGDIAQAADERLVARLTGVIERAAARGDINLAASGLTLPDLIATLLQAAAGAKQEAGRPVPIETYRARLGRIVALTAAALRPGP